MGAVKRKRKQEKEDQDKYTERAQAVSSIQGAGSIIRVKRLNLDNGNMAYVGWRPMVIENSCKALDTHQGGKMISQENEPSLFKVE